MDNRDVLIDTSIFIDFLRKKRKHRTILWRVMEQGMTSIISTITVFELYAGATTEQHIQDLKRLLRWFEVVPFSDNTAKYAATIYRHLKAENKMIDFRDIFIGATALVLDTPILTLNTRHFQRIQGIKFMSLDEFTDS